MAHYKVKVLSDPQVIFFNGQTEVVVAVVPLSEFPGENDLNSCTPVAAVLRCIAQKGDIGMVSERRAAIPRVLLGLVGTENE